jgi:hypothetical protein
VNAPIWIETPEAVALHERLLAIAGLAVLVYDRWALLKPARRRAARSDAAAAD